MNQVNESEIRQIIADVMRDTGIRIDTDDPVIAMIIIQRREIAQLVQQHTIQQQSFLDKFTEKSNSIIHSAAAFEKQKALITAEILQANSEEIALTGTKMFAQISQRSQEQFQEMAAEFYQAFETRFFRLMMILLVVQLGVLIVSMIV